MLGNTQAAEIVCRIILQSPNLVLVNDVKSFRQSGLPLVITEIKLNHQKRQIIRRDNRKKLRDRETSR